MRNTLLIARFELVRLFGSKRGWLSLLAFGLIWAVLLRYVIYNAAHYVINPDSARLIGGLTGNRGVQNLLAWPVAELSVFWSLAVYLFPFFCLVLTADQFASDRSRGTLRFVTLRSTRDSVFFGRYLGQMFIQLILVALALVTVVAMATMRDVDLLSPAIALSALIGVNLIIVLLPYTALMALVSTIARSARQATVYAIILWIAMALVINWVVPRVPEIAFVEWFLPGSQLYELLQREGWDTLSLVHIPALQSVVLLFLGRTLMRRGDL